MKQYVYSHDEYDFTTAKLSELISEAKLYVQTSGSMLKYHESSLKSIRQHPAWNPSVHHGARGPQGGDVVGDMSFTI